MIEGEILIIQPSLYYSLSRLPDDLKSINNNLNILSLNAQSLNAKFDNLQILIENWQEQNIQLHAIIIQESWPDDNSNRDLIWLQLDTTALLKGRDVAPTGASLHI